MKQLRFHDETVIITVFCANLLHAHFWPIVLQVLQLISNECQCKGEKACKPEKIKTHLFWGGTLIHVVGNQDKKNGIWCCQWDCPVLWGYVCDPSLEDKSADGIEAPSSAPTWGPTAARRIVVIRTVGSEWARSRGCLKSSSSGIQLLLLEGKEMKG